MRSCLADLTETLSESDDYVRASLRLVSPQTGRLQFALGSEIEDSGKTFSPGEGIIGRAFSECRVKNVADAPRRPEFAQADGDEPFHGLLCVPVSAGATSPVGVLCVDRTNAKIFPSASEDPTATLADLLLPVVTRPSNPLDGS